jgi:hypothetical protein
VALSLSLLDHARHPSAARNRQQAASLAMFSGYAPDLVTNSAGTLLIPGPISPPKMDGIEPFVRWGAARLGGSCHAWGDARPDRALGCVDCYARFARARYSYQSHTMRALRAVAYLTNALQVRRKRVGRPVRILRYLLAFCVWLGWMYLMAMINDALFAIFLGSSMIIGSSYIPPRSGRDRREQLPSANQ